MSSELRRFQLVGTGRPIGLMSPFLTEPAINIGLEATEITRFMQTELKRHGIESHYYRDRNAHPVALQARIDVSKDCQVHSVSVHLRKWVRDLATDEEGYASAWHEERLARIKGFTRRQNAASISHTLSNLLWQFALEFRATNEADFDGATLLP